MFGNTTARDACGAKTAGGTKQPRWKNTNLHCDPGIPFPQRARSVCPRLCHVHVTIRCRQLHSSACRSSPSFMRAETSSAGRLKFSIEKAYTVTTLPVEAELATRKTVQRTQGIYSAHSIPRSRHHFRHSLSCAKPKACPSRRFSWRCSAHRRLPSMIKATCRGIGPQRSTSATSQRAIRRAHRRGPARMRGMLK